MPSKKFNYGCLIWMISAVALLVIVQFAALKLFFSDSVVVRSRATNLAEGYRFQPNGTDIRVSVSDGFTASSSGGGFRGDNTSLSVYHVTEGDLTRFAEDLIGHPLLEYSKISEVEQSIAILNKKFPKDLQLKISPGIVRYRNKSDRSTEFYIDSSRGLLFRAHYEF